MHIGISSPVTIQEFVPFLNKESQVKANGIIGLKAPAVDSLIHSFLIQGHKVSVYTLTFEVKNRVILRGDLLTIYINPLRVNGKLRALTFFNKEINFIFESVKLEPHLPDILHAHWTYEYAQGVVKFRNRIPVIITVRDWAPKILKLNLNYYRFARYLMDFRIFKTSNLTFLANSPYIKQLVKKKWKKEVEVIPNSISNKFIKTNFTNIEKKRYIISVSNNISPAKNIEKLLIAFQKINKKFEDVELNLVGKQFYMNVPKVKKWETMGLLNKVNLIGEVDHKKLMEEYDRAIVLVHPSLEESFGNILIEALARGLPVIAGKFSGAVPYILENGKIGELCDVSSISVMENSMADMLNNKALMVDLSEKGIKHVWSKYSQEVVSNQTLAIYNKLIKE
ncbi:Glycosyltransferase involved in cell wall bisynthesis [Lutibacter agarilyticus]|uniref:Glycosyltransferase involved in cell wall bisynthesis n=1 Tax=Lutibacter agarilyticus TaxID=1109740 RepID=A0A238YV86_9FLAO|nr:glycosyltransferase family 4 protein [Lutibacter agarilyticus]SNR74718.1 Glycosyltransferase involved in cell wall bisynthesis [Lutibacter agarilyticus]